MPEPAQRLQHFRSVAAQPKYHRRDQLFLILIPDQHFAVREVLRELGVVFKKRIRGLDGVHIPCDPGVDIRPVIIAGPDIIVIRQVGDLRICTLYKELAQHLVVHLQLLARLIRLQYLIAELRLREIVDQQHIEHLALFILRVSDVLRQKEHRHQPRAVGVFRDAFRVVNIMADPLLPLYVLDPAVSVIDMLADVKGRFSQKCPEIIQHAAQIKFDLSR